MVGKVSPKLHMQSSLFVFLARLPDKQESQNLQDLQTLQIDKSRMAYPTSTERIDLQEQLLLL